MSDRPAMFFDYTIHDMWFNTKGLQAANITKDTPDPQPGFSYWRRDAEGNPEGVAIEVSWLQAYIDAGAWKPETMLPESQGFLYQKAAESGLTAVVVPGLITPNLANQPEAFKDLAVALAMLDELDEKGRLQLRSFVHMIYKKATGDVGELVKGTLERRQKYDSDRLRVAGIKIHPEGNWMTKTSQQIEPFLDGDRGNAGIPGEKIQEIILAGNEVGLDVITHVDGSATVHATVDAIEASRKAGHTEARNTLQHYHLVDPLPSGQAAPPGAEREDLLAIGSQQGEREDAHQRPEDDARVEAQPLLGDPAGRIGFVGSRTALGFPIRRCDSSPEFMVGIETVIGIMTWGFSFRDSETGAAERA